MGFNSAFKGLTLLNISHVCINIFRQKSDKTRTNTKSHQENKSCSKMKQVIQQTIAESTESSK